MTRVLVVDHHDSYTYNLVHLVAKVTGRAARRHPARRPGGARALARRATRISCCLPARARSATPTTSRSAARSSPTSEVPVLGVCLGMQGIVDVLGGKVGVVEPAHGDVARVQHTRQQACSPRCRRTSPPSATTRRRPSTFHRSLTVTAWCDGPRSRVVMGVQHVSRPLHGVQFHPESILTAYGDLLVANFIGAQLMRVGRPRGLLRRTRRAPAALVLARRLGITSLVGPDDVCRLARSRRAQPDAARRLRHGDRAHRASPANEVGTDIFAVLAAYNAEISTGLRSSGWVGFFGYAARPDLPALTDPTLTALDACWLRASRRIAFDHGRRQVFAVAPTGPPRAVARRSR